MRILNSWEIKKISAGIINIQELKEGQLSVHISNGDSLTFSIPNKSKDNWNTLHLSVSESGTGSWKDQSVDCKYTINTFKVNQGIDFTVTW